MNNVIRFPERNHEDKDSYWGFCPICHDHDGYVSVGPDHWFVCRAHRTRWWIGSNPFSCWKELSDLDHERNAAQLAGYREVESWVPPQELVEREAPSWRQVTAIPAGPPFRWVPPGRQIGEVGGGCPVARRS